MLGFCCVFVLEVGLVWFGGLLVFLKGFLGLFLVKVCLGFFHEVDKMWLYIYIFFFPCICEVCVVVFVRFLRYFSIFVGFVDKVIYIVVL